jgi:hypothetical protein
MKVPEPVIVNLLRTPKMIPNSGEIDSSESILGSINVYKYGLWMSRSFRHKAWI